MANAPQPGTWRGFLEQGNALGIQVGFDDTEPPSQPVDVGDEEVIPNPPENPLLFMTLDELLIAPGRSDLPNIHPKRRNGAGWFEYTKGITKTIKTIIENDYPHAAPNWTLLSAETKLRWFKAFAQKYNWDYSHTTLVREQFHALCATRLLDRVYEWKLLWRKGGKPTWMNRTAWTGLIIYWTIQKNAKRAKTNSNNRNSERGGFGIYKHTSGSCPHLRMRENMRDKVTGELPDMLTFMEAAHKRKSDGVFVDKKAEHIARRCRELEQEKLTEMTEDQDSCGLMELTQSERNAIYRSEVQVKKGTRFGYGKMDCDGAEGGPSQAIQSVDYEQMYHQTHSKLVEATSQIHEMSTQVKDAVFWGSVMQTMYPEHVPPSQASGQPRNNNSDFASF